MNLKLLGALASTLLFAQLPAQIVINELSAANYDGGFVDNYGDEEDWFELYNPGAAAFDISGYFLSDDDTDPMKWVVPAGVSVPANGYLVVFASDKDEFVAGNVHTNFKITQAKQEGAVLSDAGGTIIDSYMLTIPNQVGHSRGRTTDGAADWGVFLTPTPGAANAGAVLEYSELTIETIEGYYAGTVNVTVSTTDANAVIHYTVDGTEPTTASPIYTGPVARVTTTSFRAKAFNPDVNVPTSFTETNTYLVDDTHGVMIVSISGDQLPTLLGGNQIEPVGHIEIMDADGILLTEAGGDFNEHGNDSWAYPQRGIDYITQDEFGYGNELDYPLFRDKDRDGYQRVIIKAAASDNYPFENGGAHIRDAYVQSLSQIGDLRMDERTYEPCVMYVNGEYWGVYEIREKVDDIDFLDHYYDQGSGDVDFLKTWGGTWEEFGSADEWDDLRDYILGNDMTDPANYDYVKGLYNTGSLIDYFTLNSYTVCSDWLNWNTAWWRGRNLDGDKRKWRYVLWDMDATFGHYINFTGIPDQSANADPCDPAQVGDPGGQGHVPIWNALIDNEEFFADYINRFSDLSGTVFSCDFMHQHLDSLVDMIAPEMPRHIDRWGGTMTEWESNVQEIHDFIDTRCAVINDGFLDCYPQLDGPHTITLMADPPNGGSIELSSLEVDTYPFETTYFGGIDVPFNANENVGFIFSHWTANNNVITPDELLEDIVMNFTSDDTLTAHFVAEEFYEVTLNVDPIGTGSIDFNGTIYNVFPVTIEVPGGAMNNIIATPIAGWGFVNYVSTIVLDDAPIIPVNSFSTDDNGNITAHFFEVIYDVTYEVSPPNVGTIEVDGVTLDTLPKTLVMVGDVPIAVSTYSKQEFWEFSHWNIISAVPSPDEFSSDIELIFEGPDVVIANYVELPNYPLTVETDPLDIAYIRVGDDLIQNFPNTANYLGDENISLEVIERGKYEFTHWEVRFGAAIGDMNALVQNYYLASPAHLIAHFEERQNAVYIPTSFTPNGDGLNDILKVVANEIELDNFRFEIMSRWGIRLWGTTDVNQGWDGSDENGDYFVSPDTYVYFLRYENSITGEIVETTGQVVLIR